MLTLILSVMLVATGKDALEIHLLDLLGELPGGGKDQGLALPQPGVDLLQDRDRERRGLSSSRLRLGDHVEPLDARHNRALLDRGWLLKTISVDAPQQLLFQVHVVKVFTNLREESFKCQYCRSFVA